jgi:hypothetical protein
MSGTRWTDEFIDSHFPRPDAQLGLSSFATPLLVYGQVEVTVPQVGSEQSAFSQAAATANPGICPSSGSTSSNQWSVQDNVNGWTITSGPNAGDTAWVHFTIQSNGSTNAICIWNIGLTSQMYPNKCYAPPNPPSIQRSGGLQAFDFGNIAATTSPVTLQIGATLTETSGSGTDGPERRLMRATADSGGPAAEMRVMPC